MHRGSAWRDNREFVGQIKYGACYRLWNPSSNLSFGGNFRSAARLLFMCQRRPESPFSTLPDDCLFYILNMMKWDWVNDNSQDMRREQKEMRRVRRRQMREEADAIMNEAETRIGDAEQLVRVQGHLMNDVPAMGVDEGGDVYMDEDSSDSEDADTSDDSDDESAASDEYQWGDHVSSRNNFIYNHESDDSDSDEDDTEDEIEAEREGSSRRVAMLRARRSILQLLRH